MPTEVMNRITSLLTERQVGALVVSSPENVTYMAGYEVPSQAFPIRERLVFCVVTPTGDEVMLVPDMEASMAQSSSQLADVRDYNEFTDDPIAVFTDILRELQIIHEPIAIEDDFIPGLYFSALNKHLPDTNFIPAKSLMAELRLIKTPGEIDKLRRVGVLAEKAHHYAVRNTHLGMTEREMAQFYYSSVLSQGGDSIKELIIGSGERSEFANANPTSRRLHTGDLVRMDVLAKIDGYLSDVARTAVVGTPSPEQCKIWEILVEARALLLSMIKPGAITGDIFHAYEEYIEKAGLKSLNFVGHGLGLTVHEDPYISRYHSAELLPGMVLAIEPLYLQPKAGYHVEDTVVVTENGYELITGISDPEELLTIDAKPL